MLGKYPKLDLDVVLCVGPLRIDPGTAMPRVQTVHPRSDPHTLLAPDAGRLVLHDTSVLAAAAS